MLQYSTQWSKHVHVVLQLFTMIEKKALNPINLAGTFIALANNLSLCVLSPSSTRGKSKIQSEKFHPGDL